ncbi:hypothetical protein cypCar_00037802 [Cyprinus carpio]|nr:hypothetical protein cypCar_00037802 [Cyprinus carpio]
MHKIEKKAQNELAGKGVGISDDLITLEVMSPDVCDLTLIDLPGIARVPLKGQPEDIGEQIKRLIIKFIEKQETINLVVVPCNIDIATTEALKMAQEVDPEGKRTVAILTKPDLIDTGTEKSVLAIVHNEVIPLRKGYTMTLKRFNDQINSLSSGELIFEENLFAQLRAEFKKWNDHLNSSKPSFSDSKVVSQENRGRELPGFSNYKVFETVLQKHVAELKEPANDLLRGMKGQKEKAEQRILEQFEMENLIYTQDPIFLKILSEITKEWFLEEQLPMFDKECTYSQMMKAHYEIVVQRMADQLPMMITLFMLKETAELLSTDILSLLDGANVSELLFEDSDVSKRRKDLRDRLDRLTAAQAELTEFI